MIVVCQDLSDALKTHKKLLFDVSGGCGIDTSLGEHSCMENVGLWFRFCPFCGRRIVSTYSPETFWSWHEEDTCPQPATPPR